MFTTIIVQPIFNLLAFIYAILPGHNFGLAIIIFTIVVRILMWPLVKKQIHHAKAMRELAPELRKIKIAAKGDRQKESALTMELYKEKEINPFASLGIILVQLPILIGLYVGLRRIICTRYRQPIQNVVGTATLPRSRVKLVFCGKLFLRHVPVLQRYGPVDLHFPARNSLRRMPWLPAPEAPVFLRLVRVLQRRLPHHHVVNQPRVVGPLCQYIFWTHARHQQVPRTPVLRIPQVGPLLAGVSR